jgi:hypothetical protein
MGETTVDVIITANATQLKYSIPPSSATMRGMAGRMMAILDDVKIDPNISAMKTSTIWR